MQETTQQTMRPTDAVNDAGGSAGLPAWLATFIRDAERENETLTLDHVLTGQLRIAEELLYIAICCIIYNILTLKAVIGIYNSCRSNWRHLA